MAFLSWFALLAVCAPSVDSGPPPPTGYGEAVVAVYRDGRITNTEFEGWRQSGRSNQVSQSTPERQLIEDLVVLKVLRARFVDLGLGETKEYKNRHRQLLSRLARQVLEADLRARVSVSKEEIRLQFEGHRERYQRPSRWRLSSLFLRFDEQGQAEQRRLMNSIRDQVEAGADFSEMVREHSDSATRFRGGDTGFVTLEELAQPVAESVTTLRKGDLSQVIETEGGLALIVCTDFIEARKFTLESATPQIKKGLRKKKIEALIEDIKDPEKEADRRGLLASSEYYEKLAREELQLQAQLAANAEAERWISKPSEKEIEELYEKRKDRLVTPTKRRVRALVDQIDLTRSRAYYDSLERLAVQVKGSEGSLEEISARLKPRAEIRDFGWMTDDQVWMLGRAADAAIGELEVGGVSSVVQEGKTLYVFQLLEKRAGGSLSREEGIDHIRGVILAQRRRQAGREVRAAILAEQKIQFEVSESTPPAEGETQP